MRAGRLNKRIVIEQKTTVDDDFGQPIETWSTFATVWASVEYQSGKEGFTADQLQAELITRFRIRYLANVTALMRVKFSGVVYDIQSVMNTNERDREMLILAKTHD